MSLVTYEETRPWAKAIKERVIQRQMPPWHIDRTVGVRKFKYDMSLADEQIRTIVRWVDAGAPLGNPEDLPPPKQWPQDNDWRAAKELGPPDLVIKSVLSDEAAWGVEQSGRAHAKRANSVATSRAQPESSATGSEVPYLSLR